MRIEVINPVNRTEYDAIALQFGTIFNTSKWLATFDNILIYGIYDEGGNLIGGFHLYREKKFGITVYRNPPFTPLIGPFIKNEAKNAAKIANKNREILLLIADYLDKFKHSIISVSLGRNIIDTLPFIWKKYKAIAGYTYIIDLSYSIEELYKSISPEKRNDINRAKRDNAVIKRIFEFNIVKSLVLKTFSRQEKNINEKYLDKILFEFANENNSFAFATYIEGKPVASVFCIFDTTTAYYLLGGYDHENKHRGAGVIAMWEAIKHSKNIGLKYFDFEGSMVPQIERYFRNFGGNLTPYFRMAKAYLPLEIALKLFKRELF